MAGRKLFNRSQNSSRTGANTTRSFSDIPATTPGKVFASSSFRSGLQNGNNSKFTFSPRVPHNTIRESFPTVTPGRSLRGSSVDISGRAMSKASGSHLFQMRIASPPPELDGEELAKQVPESSNRVGSVYADEFLSHLVPPELDDLQRRQFLCILDLRRLKYAATEIFAKKDWRVNIMNFAKEYEKSRSLIMLRYGLYEFKTVPASRELLKKWKQDNNIADEDEEMADDSAPKANGTSNNFRSSVKRRAEDDLTKDEVSTSLSSTPNKRRATDREPLGETAALFSNAGATPMPKKSKRGVDAMDVSDENQPSKLQKSMPSTTLSIFEEIANNSPARSIASPAKPAPKSLPATAQKPSLFAQPSQSALTKTSTFGSNIFGHLSKQNTPKGSDNEESEAGESENDAEEEQEEDAPAKKSEVASAAPVFGSAAPSLFGAKPSAATSTSSSSPFSQSQGGSLFDRMSKGADGEPLKAADTEADKPSDERPVSPAKQSVPQDKTWNPNTPIRFGGSQPQPSTPLFGASTAQPGSLFSKPTETPTFGTQAKDFATETPKPAATSLFGQSAKPSEAGTGLFGNANKSFTFGKPEEKAQDTAATPSTPSLFGTTASTTPFGRPADTPAPQGQAKSLFGNLNTPAPTAQSSGASLFGAATEKPASSLFGATNGDKPAAPASLFSTKNTSDDKKEESSAKRKKSGDDEASDRPAKIFSFGGPAPPPAQNPPPKTAAAANGATDAASVFGTVESGSKTFSFGAAPAPAPTATPTPAPPASTSLFGNTSTTQNEPAKTQPSIFASSTTPSSGFTFGATSSAPSNTPIFGATVTNTSFDANKGSGFSFGSNPEPAAGGSFTFNAGNDSVNNPFAKPGDSSQPPSFNFGTQSQTPAAPAAGAFQFGGSSTSAAAPTTSFTFGAGSQPANDAPAPMFGASTTNVGSSMFSFGGSQQPAQPAAPIFGGQPANAAQGIFASQLAVPPPGSSTGTSKFTTPISFCFTLLT